MNLVFYSVAPFAQANALSAAERRNTVSTPKAIKNALRVAAEFKTQDVNKHIIEGLESY